MASVATWWPHQSGLLPGSASNFSQVPSSLPNHSLTVANGVIPTVNFPTSWPSSSGWLDPSNRLTTPRGQTQIINNNWTNSTLQNPGYSNYESWGPSGYSYLSQGWLNQQAYNCGQCQFNQF
jgi:hypothetical protein